MKHISVTLLFIFCTQMIMMAQNTESIDSIRYITEEDQAYRLHEEKKSLFQIIPLSYEHKVSDNFSLSYKLLPTAIGSYIDLNFALNLGIEGRYYYQMKNRIKSGKQANNLSGKYISAGSFVGYGSFRVLAPVGTERIAGLYGGVTFGIGKQKRIYSSFLWDNKFQAEYTRLTFGEADEIVSGLSISRRSSLGIVLNGKSKNKEDSQFFPSIKVNINSKFALRFVENNYITLIRLKNYLGINTIWNLNLSPNVVSELKIGNSSFSFIQDYQTRISFSNVKNDVEGSFELDKKLYRLQAGTRYYYKMKKEILSGENGNNFTGQYFTTMFSFQNTDDPNTYRTYALAGWGYQLEVGDSFFLNLGINVAAKLSGPSRDVDNNSLSDLTLTPRLIEIKLNVGRRLF